MTVGRGLDLSGDWQGVYNYPDGSPPVAFEATIRETGGTLVGTIREVDEWIDPGLVLEATIDGAREGLHVRFSKYYENGEEGFDFVLYEGEVRDDGLEIHGRWDIPGVHSGSFLMVRRAGATEEAERHVAETVR